MASVKIGGRGSDKEEILDKNLRALDNGEALSPPFSPHLSIDKGGFTKWIFQKFIFKTMFFSAEYFRKRLLITEWISFSSAICHSTVSASTGFLLLHIFLDAVV